MSLHLSPNKLLLPLVPAYRLAIWLHERRMSARPASMKRLRFPVVSIGNLSTGGAGKTPLTMALAETLTRRGLLVDVLSRGYGRRTQIPARVALAGTAEEFGDEPLLIAREADVPVYVADQRYDAGLLAEGDATAVAVLGQKPRPLVHLLDDGFQHRQLHRDVDILLLDRKDWRDWLLPAGNLREPLTALRRATVIAIPAEDPELEENLKAWGWEGPVWRLRRKMEIPAVDGPVAAFCGIARPRQFFDGLEAGGLELTARKAFPDHYAYTARDLERLVKNGRAAGAVALVTTGKDRVRMGKLISGVDLSLPLKTAGLRIEIEDTAMDWLLARLMLAPTLTHAPL
ncbi:MAG TPA: tetraacyldisaccharide 4'-kinase [Terracidiphilus sp.]|jgi:tetraacyldisaccharide 4'-kinase|nr:tetraacyldisaccharide 4'-kinase [Terracidiphilus sp.]